ncbi:MAG TPA: NAD(P)/FAD-dependent oxidoreductase [Pyrinomonadaceae bacterium]|nr:NAD(P)/FAD-dependent oxidoreductase [Pyrinomonadaceae bacterium]
MDAEVIVVGAGIGGLTVAALLAARGVDVCVLERESRVGGCLANFESFGYRFEPGYGLYSGWRPGEIHDQVFSQLPIEPPQVHLLEPSYVVRLPDKSEVRIGGNSSEFEGALRAVFPECADEAVVFYRKLVLISDSPQSVANNQEATEKHLEGTSLRFRKFIDLQLHTFTQGGSAEVSLGESAMTLTAPFRGMYSIRGGGSALAEKLAESIKKSGGRIRLNTPVLRLHYDTTGHARGVDLLSGETATATKVIISNLTLWDTYGKLVGVNRTPNDVRAALKSMRSWGSYLIFAGLEEAVSLPASHVLTLTAWADEENYDPEHDQIMFAAAPGDDPRAPEGKRAATIHTFTDVDEWFTFHRDETELEEHDQRMLEECWQRLHRVMPELGGDIEVVETLNPRGFYDSTRRKLGMVGGVTPTLGPPYFTSSTFLPNLRIISDTVARGGVAGVTRAALSLAQELTR